MPEGDWHKQIIFAGLVGTLLLAIALRIDHTYSSDPNYQSRKTYYQESADRSMTWGNSAIEKGDSPTSSGDGDAGRTKNPDWHDALDLAAQWASAEAANKIVVLTVIQALIGFAGLIGLGMTVVYARHTLQLTAETSNRELRAYLSMNFKSIGDFVPGSRVRFEFIPYNHGSTPANKVRHVFSIGILRDVFRDDFVLPIPTTPLADVTIFPSSSSNSIQYTWFFSALPFSQADIDEVAAGRAYLACWGVTSYVDVFEDKVRTVKFFAFASGENFVTSQRLAFQGVTTELPHWNYEYGPGHGETN